MRIQRLPEDNLRTQGAHRRQWYRQHSPEHLRAVTDVVERALAARAPGAPSSAVVLGAGACTELPLARLARACDRVVLVDLDAPGMGRARQELAAALRHRVDAVAADISGGVSAALASRLQQQPWSDLAALSQAAVLGAAASCLERVPVPDPPSLAALGSERFGLVISALVLTQLFSLPLLDTLDLLRVVAPRITAPDADPRYHAAANGLRRRIALAHLSLLAALLAPAGAGALITDQTGYLLAPTVGPPARAAREALPVLPPEVLDLPADVEQRFTVLDPLARWQWLVTGPSRTQSGRAYDVLGMVLRPLGALGDPSPDGTSPG